jgi:hypothetical protein
MTLSGELKGLQPEMVATLRQLRREVDDLQDDVARGDKNAASRLFYARERLREFTHDLRKQGYLI